MRYRPIMGALCALAVSASGLHALPKRCQTAKVRCSYSPAGFIRSAKNQKAQVLRIEVLKGFGVTPDNPGVHTQDGTEIEARVLGSWNGSAPETVRISTQSCCGLAAVGTELLVAVQPLNAKASSWTGASASKETWYRGSFSTRLSPAAHLPESSKQRVRANRQKLLEALETEYTSSP